MCLVQMAKLAKLKALNLTMTTLDCVFERVNTCSNSERRFWDTISSLFVYAIVF